MRIPFDLIAVILAVYAFRGSWAANPQVHWARQPDAIRAQAHQLGEAAGSTAEAFTVLGLFFLLVWLYHEFATRLVERYTAYGRRPYGVARADGRLSRLHPYEFHSRLVLIGQVLMASGYAAFIWLYRWPLKTCAWPEWLGLAWLDVPGPARDFLGQSQLAGTLTDVGPFALAMIISWIPRRRFLAGPSRSVSTRAYLGFEARLTFLPLVLFLCFSFFGDAFELAKFFMPPDWSEAVEHLPAWALFPLSLVALAGFAVLVVPWLIVKIWDCQPLPDGPLRARLQDLMRRSGVGARAILAWGGPGTGFLNAAVVGPWARMRYILISPSLADHLTPRECEAVLAHELGHARYGHLTTLLLSVLIFGSVGSLAASLLPEDQPLLQAAVYLLAAGIFLRFVMGRIMRACEQEADLASAELVGDPEPLVTALEKVAILAGGIRDLFSWHHGTIAGRIRHVREVGLDSARGEAYHRRLKWVRRGMLALTVLLLALEFGLVLNSADRTRTQEETPDRPAASNSAPASR